MPDYFFSPALHPLEIHNDDLWAVRPGKPLFQSFADAERARYWLASRCFGAPKRLSQGEGLNRAYLRLGVRPGWRARWSRSRPGTLVSALKASNCVRSVVFRVATVGRHLAVPGKFAERASCSAVHLGRHVAPTVVALQPGPRLIITMRGRLPSAVDHMNAPAKGDKIIDHDDLLMATAPGVC